MAIVHIRNLAKYGVITDVDPNDLPPEAWSFGVNIRYRNGKVTGAPVFRSAAVLGTTDPRFVFGVRPPSGLDYVFVGYNGGTVTLYSGGVEIDYSITGYTPVISEAAWATTTLAGVIYVNREDRVPWAFRPTDTTFVALPNWDASWRTHILRSCGGALVALNVTKGSTQYPTMVKTSSLPLSGAVPVSWDETTPSTLATENILAEMSGPIVDASNFGSALCIYGSEEAWLMRADGSLLVYEYNKLPFNKGAINSNCSLEVDGRSYVFGPDDLWMHDGVTAQSLCDQKTRDFIFASINAQKARSCFVTHNAQLREIYFCYVSGDRGVSFLNADNACNRQAVYNYDTGTWTFDDLPLVFSGGIANLSVTLTYATVVGTYDTFGGTYQDLEDGYKRTPVYVGVSSTEYGLSTSLYAFDPYGEGSTAPFNVDINATRPRYLERDGIDLDELNVDLKGYKSVSSVYPQGRLGPSTQPLMIAYGASDYFGQPPVFSDYQPFDANEAYKLDYRAAGRYLSMRIQHNDYREMALTGLDIDMQVLGHR